MGCVRNLYRLSRGEKIANIG